MTALLFINKYNSDKYSERKSYSSQKVAENNVIGTKPVTYDQEK